MTYEKNSASTTPIIFESFHPITFASRKGVSATRYKIKKNDLEFLHYHNYVEIGICVSGSSTLYINNEELICNATDIQVALPYQPHYTINTDNDNPSEWIYLCFTPLKIESEGLKPSINLTSELIQNKITANGIFRAEEYPYLASLANKLANISFSDDKYKDDKTTLTILEILIELAEISEAKNFNPQKISNGTFDTILPAISLVRKNTMRHLPITVSDMAKSCNMSESYFRKTFTAAVGYSPKAYIDKALMGIAEDLLISTNSSINDIMSLLGFEESSTFYRLFTKYHHGTSPTEYRRNARK